MFRRVEQLPKLRDISDDIAMADHNAFRFAGGSAGKKQDSFGVAARFWNSQEPQKQTCGNQNRNHPPENDLTCHTRHQFIQLQNVFRPRKIFESFHELGG